MVSNKILKQIAKGEIPKGYELKYSSEFEKELKARTLSVYDECEACGQEGRLLDCLCIKCWRKNKNDREQKI